jgi:hypothetical protein
MTREERLREQIDAMRRLRAWMEGALERARADFARAMVEGKMSWCGKGGGSSWIGSGV